MSVSARRAAAEVAPAISSAASPARRSSARSTPSPACVSSWVTTRMRPSGPSVLKAGHTTTSRCEGTSVTRRAARTRGPRSPRSPPAPDPLMRSVNRGARLARDHHEVPLAQPRPLHDVAHARIAGLQGLGQRVDRQPARSDHDEVARAVLATGPTSQGWRSRRLDSERMRQPRPVRTAVRRRAAAKVPRMPLRRRASGPRAWHAPADVDRVDGQLDVAQPHRAAFARPRGRAGARPSPRRPRGRARGRGWQPSHT